MRKALVVAVRDWLASATGFDAESIIPAQDKGPRPDLPYLAITVSSVRLSGTPNERKTLGVYDEPLVAQRSHHVATVQVAGYGAGVLGVLAAAEAAAWDREQAAAASMSITPIAGVRDLTTVRGTAFEEQAVLELSVGFVAETTPAEYEYAEQLRVAGEVSDMAFTVEVDL